MKRDIPRLPRRASSPKSFSDLIKPLLFLLIFPLILIGCSDRDEYTDYQTDTISHTENGEIENEEYVSFSPVDGHFPLASNGTPVPLYIHENDDPGVIRAFRNLQADIERVTNTESGLYTDTNPDADRIVIAGTIGQNPEIDRLIEEGKLDVTDVVGKWETFVITVVEEPFPGTDEGLVIAGSDKRGAIYGIYELSEKIGVSPWYWWADVPVVQQSDLYISPEPHSLGEPAVKYRGIFINNENPGLLGWVTTRYGGFNHEFYEHVFELILRQKGNYLWPAMWGKAFHDDDPMNPKLADEYGVVIGYSHHEPLMRSHIEWSRYGEGPWDYSQNEDRLREFWTEGIERIYDYETTVTLGMRGDGDMPLSDDRNIELMEQIIADQREIIREHAQDTSKITQYWALYKEVQEYYEMGMTVPDDVMILLANDNWGNIRLLPDPETAHEREGGWGMYYHFDYVGGPRTYKTLNTTQIARIWEQMNLTYQHGVDELWLVNVGDIKPHEFPISFFLDFAWNADEFTHDDMDTYPVNWARQNFGPKYAEEIGHILTVYTRINSRRKPELLDEDTYSLQNFREAERVLEEWEELREITETVKSGLPEKYYDAFYQLVEYKVEAASSLHEMYMETAKNRAYARQVRNTTNDVAERVRDLFNQADEIRGRYHSVADGKWKHQADQTYIGYTSWAQPYADRMPYVDIIHTPYDRGVMAVSAENSLVPWPGPFSYPGPTAADEPKLPVFDKFNQQEYYFDIFNQGSEPFDYEIEVNEPWVTLTGASGSIDTQEKVWVSIDWDSVPHGEQEASIYVTGPNAEWDEHTAEIKVEVFNPETPSRNEIRGFVESNGYVSMEAGNYDRNITKDDLQWKKIPQLGRTQSAMSPWPVVADVQEPGNPDTPRLEYDMHIFNPGEVTVRVYLSPTKNYSKNFRNLNGIRYALSFNDDEPTVVNMHDEMPEDGGFDTNVWYEWTRNNAIIKETTTEISEAGLNTLKFWLVDTGVVLQKIVVETDDVPETYLGPPESFRAN